MTSQQKHLEGVKGSLTEDISRIREQVQSMITEALVKRQAEKKRVLSGSGVSSDGGGEGGKNKEREKLERQIKELEEQYKEEVVKLKQRTEAQ